MLEYYRRIYKEETAYLKNPPEDGVFTPANKKKLPVTHVKISPDGKRLAFVYRGDIWIALGDGGRALPLTQHVESDAYPVFSPDGKWVAYISNESGRDEVYVQSFPVSGAKFQISTTGGTEPQWRKDEIGRAHV